MCSLMLLRSIIARSLRGAAINEATGGRFLAPSGGRAASRGRFKTSQAPDISSAWRGELAVLPPPQLERVVVAERRRQQGRGQVLVAHRAQESGGSPGCRPRWYGRPRSPGRVRHAPWHGRPRAPVPNPLTRMRPTRRSSTGSRARAASWSASSRWRAAVSWPSSRSSTARIVARSGQRTHQRGRAKNLLGEGVVGEERLGGGREERRLALVGAAGEAGARASSRPVGFQSRDAGAIGLVDAGRQHRGGLGLREGGRGRLQEAVEARPPPPGSGPDWCRTGPSRG